MPRDLSPDIFNGIIWFRCLWYHENLEEDMYKLILVSELADGLAHPGAHIAAHIVMTQRMHIYCLVRVSCIYILDWNLEDISFQVEWFGLGQCCRIWSWSPMLCEKHGPRDSVDKNRGRRPRILSLLRPEGHVIHMAWETMIKSYYSTLTDWFFLRFIHMNMNFSPLNWAIFLSLHGC